jgi:SAM-dependent methyltransferase
MGSYTSQSVGLKAWLRDVRRLYESHLGQVSGRVDFVLTKLRRLERQLAELYGFTLEDRDVLDIGAGQFLMQMHYFAQRNRPVGIDFDVIAQGTNPGPYLKMLWLNGFRRTLKTIGRKLLGVDRRYAAVVKKQLNVRSLPRLPVFQMDACNMTLRNASFDFVHCYSVFHHLPDPGAAVDGIVRVLRPGGIVYISLHLYTSENGSLDARAMSGQRGDFPSWAHLRPQFAKDVQPNAFLNRLRIDDWRELFRTRMPGAHLIFNRTDRPGIEQDARALLDAGELNGYSLEELVTHEVVILWKKG